MIWHDLIYPVKTECGNCSACCFRNATVLCKKMICESDEGFVYWTSKKPGLAGGFGISELIDFYAQNKEIIKAECLKKIENLK